MATQEFRQSEHFNTFDCLSGHLQLRWKNDIAYDDSANKDTYILADAIEFFSGWIDEHEDEWSSYTLKFFDEDFNEINSKVIIAYDDDDAEKIAKEIFANDMMNTDHIEIYDWKENYINTID